MLNCNEACKAWRKVSDKDLDDSVDVEEEENVDNNGDEHLLIRLENLEASAAKSLMTLQ